MYHSAAFKFSIQPKKMEEALYQQLTAITLFHRMTREHFKIGDNYRRAHYRVPVTQDLPFHLQIKLFVKGEDDLYHGCNVMDISAGGLLAILPFENKGHLFKTSSMHDAVLEFGGQRYKCSLYTVRSSRIDLSLAARKFMQKLGKIKAPDTEVSGAKS